MRPALRLAAVTGALMAVLSAAPAQAHPLGNFTVNFFSDLQVSQTDVEIHYVLDMAEIPTFSLQGRIGELRGTELAAYGHKVGERLLDGVTLTADGAPVSLAIGRVDAEFLAGRGGLDTFRVDAWFEGELRDPEAVLHYSDSNYSDRIGWREIVARAIEGQGIVRSSVPASSISDALRAYPDDLLASPLDVTTAEIELRPGAGAAGTETNRRRKAPSDLGTGFDSLIGRDLSPFVVLTSIALAMGFGALHALGPGHGKTIMAAYLIGAGGRVRHAVSIGVAVSLMHTASVTALALFILGAERLFPPESVYPWLSLASGLVVLGLGAYLLRMRLGSRVPTPVHHHAHDESRDHDHHDHGHHDHDGHHHHDERQHAHDHGHDHGSGHGHDHGSGHGHDHGSGHGHSHELPAGVSALSWKGLGLIAVSGGLLPSPTAVVVLLGAVALSRIAYGAVLVAAFSVGLAGALTIVGILVLRAREVAERRLSGRLGALIPVLSASAIVAVGLFLTTRAVVGLPV